MIKSIKRKKFLCIAVVFVLAACLCSCGGAVKLKSDAAKEITSAYSKRYNFGEEEISFVCYGKFEKTYVLMLNRLSIKAPTSVTVDGVTFRFPTPEKFDVYRDGKFYTVKDAFDRGFLTHDNLLTVLRNHKAEHPELYEDK